MNRTPLYAILGLTVLGYGAYAAYQWTQADEGQVVKSTAKRTTSPVSKLTTETGKPRAAKALKLSRKDDVGTEVEEKDLVKQSKPVAELDAKFATWRDDGRKAVEDMFGGDRQKIGDAFRAAMANEEFRANFGRMRELESQYRGATDDQKQAIMDELSTIRTRGLGMLKQAAAGAPPSNQPTVTVTGAGVVRDTNGLSPSAPAPAAPAPVAPVTFE
ncbi:MAG: hypothetical protein FJ384_04600 [Verrucomicrobia bacterium]|nr:hypothetical protein [Verrucomicrobiota bacterium]